MGFLLGGRTDPWLQGSARRRWLRGKPVVDAVGRNGGGTLPNLRGATWSRFGLRISAPVRNWPIAPETVQGSPQTLSEPGESPKEGSPIDAYHSLSTEANNCAESAANCAENDLGHDFIGTLVPEFQLRPTPMPPEIWDELGARAFGVV